MGCGKGQLRGIPDYKPNRPMKKGLMLIVTDPTAKAANYHKEIEDEYNIIHVLGSDARVEIIKEPVSNEVTGEEVLSMVKDIIKALTDNYGNKIPAHRVIEELAVLR